MLYDYHTMVEKACFGWMGRQYWRERARRPEGGKDGGVVGKW